MDDGSRGVFLPGTGSDDSESREMEFGTCMHVLRMATRWREELDKHRQRPLPPGFPEDEALNTVAPPRGNHSLPAPGQLALLGTLYGQSAFLLSKVSCDTISDAEGNKQMLQV